MFWRALMSSAATFSRSVLASLSCISRSTRWASISSTRFSCWRTFWRAATAAVAGCGRFSVISAAGDCAEGPRSCFRASLRTPRMA
eukprot:5568824-Pyramimonas_sp.AAC.1